MSIKIYFLCCLILFGIMLSSYMIAGIAKCVKNKSKTEIVEINLFLLITVFISLGICSLVPVFNIIVTGFTILEMFKSIIKMIKTKRE